jgi:hypothetical protein
MLTSYLFIKISLASCRLLKVIEKELLFPLTIKSCSLNCTPLPLPPFKILLFVYLLCNCFLRPSGDLIPVPPADVLIPNVSIGDIVTFSFESGSRRLLPLNPRICKIRTDVSWEDVVNNYAEEKKYITGLYAA